MNIHAEPLFVRAEIDRRLELFGVTDARRRTPAVTHRPGALARALRRVVTALQQQPSSTPATGRPRHP